MSDAEAAVRVPLIRFGSDDSPIAWWERLFAPVVIPVVLIVAAVGVIVTILLLGGAALLAIPFFSLYPDRAARDYDFGTEREQELMRRYRRFTSRVPLWRRLWRLLTLPFRRRRSRPPQPPT